MPEPAALYAPGDVARRRQLAALGLAVLVAHLWLAGRVLPPRLGEGAADTRPRRIEVAFVRELAPAAPPAAAAAPAPPPQRRIAALAPGPAASAALVEADALPPVAAMLPAPDPAPPLQISPPPLLLPPAAVAPAAQSFEWPPSTRLSYRLTGWYRGAVEGQAQVEWLRAGTQYQVFMDLGIGPSFAPLMSRRVSSEGEITPEGLSPRRYDEVTHVILRDPRSLTIFLDAERVRLPGGQNLPRPPGLQDSASQFVQLTWLFTTRPALLQPGQSIELPLALPRVVEPWTYDVLGVETLATPAGPVDALHVKPRREPRPGVDLTAEIWVAPSLQYLPVRILIRQDAETYIDLLLDRLPEQAAAPR